ncbi:MAG: segregation and condensation protein A [Planctomycetota bacterium]
MTEGADYRVDLSIYNGPLDLLLYLIRERELDIFDIPIAEVTEQFLAHIEVVKRIDVDRAGDFLLMAATLMLIKSRMLLPRQEDEDDHDEELDPRTDLVRQLLEYKQYKDLSRSLAHAERERDRRFEGSLLPPEGEAPDAGKLLEDVGVDDLLLAFERMMRETLGGVLAFRDLFVSQRDRLFIVSVFLCLLEMLKARKIDIEMGGDLVDLQIRLRADAQPANRVS